MSKVNLGDIVKDPITGYEGTAIGRTEWLNGCARITVQMPGVKPDGGLYDSQAFDEPQLEVVKSVKTKNADETKGGFDIKVTNARKI
jgi:hypothetical protein